MSSFQDKASLNEASVYERLCEAIYNQQLADVADAIALESGELTEAERQLVDSARHVCQQIYQQTRQQAETALSQLQAAQIACHFDQDGINPNPQYHYFSIELDEEDPTRAVEHLKQSGYWHPLSTRDLYWRSFCRSHSELTLTCVDDVSTRLNLRWAPATAGKAVSAGGVLKALMRRLSRSGKADNASDKRFLGDLLSTPRALLPQLLEFAEVTSDDVLVDIGCGDGRVLIEAARRNGCRGIGIEHQRELCDIASRNINQEGLADRVKVIHGDSTTAPLKDVTVVFLFIPVQALRDYLPELLQQLQPETRVIAHEQTRLDVTPAPDLSLPLIGDAAITVAHLWRSR